MGFIGVFKNKHECSELIRSEIKLHDYSTYGVNQKVKK